MTETRLTKTGYKSGHSSLPFLLVSNGQFALFQNFAIRWHHLQLVSKAGHQVVSLAFWHCLELHCWYYCNIALDCSIGLVSLSARVTSIKLFTNSTDSACCICYNFGHQMAPLALVTLALQYCLRLFYCIGLKFGHWFNLATCIGSKVVHQVQSLALPHCLGLSYWLYQLVSSWYLYQPESHQ